MFLTTREYWPATMMVWGRYVLAFSCIRVINQQTWRCTSKSRKNPIITCPLLKLYLVIKNSTSMVCVVHLYMTFNFFFDLGMIEGIEYSIHLCRIRGLCHMLVTDAVNSSLTHRGCCRRQGTGGVLGPNGRHHGWAACRVWDGNAFRENICKNWG